ncbi:uncharacterized protein LOC124959988 isoform X2 [Sciurus carolinensis]|uniref:uncharacterized protein LOC124959988 isoform X2 n=1 Tax=Sciurus carolinensis TaxID=30640 RepID=UPI001FB4E1B1|nr:uncharacterized protein LOC124959988 isoform X2 [Sciurus carolinensis]
MSEQKGIPLIISLRSARERLNQQLRRLSKALSHGSSGLAHIHGHSPLELGYKRAQLFPPTRNCKSQAIPGEPYPPVPH